MMKVLICGARDYDNRVKIAEQIISLATAHRDLLVISGAAPGADSLAAEVARENDVHVAEVKALWATRHRGAGPQRNKVMLAMEPDLVLAFHPDLENSKGTADMVKRARRAGVSVMVIS